MRELGLIEGGYNNDYRLEREAGKWSIQNKFNKVLRLAAEQNPQRPKISVSLPEVLTGEDMLIAAAEGLSGEKLSFAEARQLLLDKGILTAEIEARAAEWSTVPRFAEMLMISANLYQYLCYN